MRKADGMFDGHLPDEPLEWNHRLTMEFVANLMEDDELALRFVRETMMGPLLDIEGLKLGIVLD